MTDAEFHELLNRFRTGKCSPEEEVLINQFFEKNEEKTSVISQWPPDKKEAVKASLKAGVLRSFVKPDLKKPGTTVRIWIGVAASLALFIFAYTYFFTMELSRSSEPIELVTKTTSKGQKATITLPDGSVLKLNSESSITYPKQFNKNVREVSLNGEAFFEVAGNPKKPFIVSSEGLRTKVLGTSFNINAYKDFSEIAVTVVTGRVEVSGKDKGEAYSLH